ncbi:hypothetical protein D3C80_1605640 [compost metagenome]
MLFEIICICPAPHGENTFQIRKIFWCCGTASCSHDQHIIICYFTILIGYIFIFTVDVFYTYTLPDIYIKINCFLLGYPDKIRPAFFA